MSFRKRNTVLSSAPVTGPAARVQQAPPPGTRPSPLDGRLTTSTGTSSLDGLLAGHAGLPLGTSLLVEEQGTTDFAGVLLRYFAAEGLVQGHHVHVLGVPDAWKRELPGLASQESKGTSKAPASVLEDRMKIAWRYEALSNQKAVPNAVAKDSSGASGTTFCHAFDLSKRLLPKDSTGSIFAYPMPSPLDALSLEPTHSSQESSMSSLLSKLQTHLTSDSGTAVHRVIIPSLMSPTLYDGSSCLPYEVLPFLHGLRGLLRQHSGRLSVMLSLPTTLFPRHNGLTRWIELLCDGVIELVPLPPSATETPATSKASSKDAEKAQGMARVYTMPAYHEKGGGGPEGKQFRQDLSFSLSSSRGLVIKPYSLPPLEDDENHHEKSPASTVKDGIDF